jgi:hypothetical protein
MAIDIDKLHEFLGKFNLVYEVRPQSTAGSLRRCRLTG